MVVVVVVVVIILIMVGSLTNRLFLPQAPHEDSTLSTRARKIQSLEPLVFHCFSIPSCRCF